MTGQISVVESLEQTKTRLRFKSPKSGKSRTVRGVVELRALTRAQERLRLGLRLSNDDLVISHAGRPGYFPDLRLPALGTHFPHHQAGTGSTTCRTLTRPICSPTATTRGSPARFGAQ
jgi:hypothetical protein